MTRPKITRARLRALAVGAAGALAVVEIGAALLYGEELVALAFVLGAYLVFLTWSVLAAIDEWDASRRLRETQERVMGEIKQRARAAAVANARHRESARWN